MALDIDERLARLRAAEDRLCAFGASLGQSFGWQPSDTRPTATTTELPEVTA
jgi:hypothetical protein